jgi:hypothetical protein
LEKAIRGTYYNNNYKLEIEVKVAEDLIHGRKRLFNSFTLSKWENEHESFFENDVPDYYKVGSGEWKIENENLELRFSNDDVNFEDLNYQIIPINFDPSTSLDHFNWSASFILRGKEQNFFHESISQGDHSE